MHHFAYRNGVLHCEDVSLEAVARELGTPAYVYSDATLRRHYSVLADAFANRDVLIAFAVKANSNIGVLSTLASVGAGADVVSGGEMLRALEAGIPANRIVFRRRQDGRGNEARAGARHPPVQRRVDA